MFSFFMYINQIFRLDLILFILFDIHITISFCLEAIIIQNNSRISILNCIGLIVAVKLLFLWVFVLYLINILFVFFISERIDKVS